jgi:hypothetical protein
VCQKVRLESDSSLGDSRTNCAPMRLITHALPTTSEGPASGGKEKPAHRAGLSEAADGTRTHDLLHGKQWLNRGSPLSMRDQCQSDTRGLPAITGDLGNEWVTESRRSAADGQRVQRSLNAAKHAACCA